MARKLTLFVAVFAIVFGVYQFDQHRVHAQIHRPASVSASCGRCVGYAHLDGSDALIFEGGDGTIRLLNLDNGGTLAIPRSQ